MKRKRVLRGIATSSTRNRTAPNDEPFEVRFNQPMDETLLAVLGVNEAGARLSYGARMALGVLLLQFAQENHPEIVPLCKTVLHEEFPEAPGFQ